jgi:uncharacterized protein YprB with RNaseH-like and TPR domain
MIQHIPLEKILFLDIETVPGSGSWEELPETEQKLWEKKTRFQRKEDVSAAEFYDRAGIMAEFGKIICITIGMVEKNDTLKIKSFSGHDEKKMLQEFGEIFNSPRLNNVILCAHNGKEFDFPWIARRYLINGMQPRFRSRCLEKNHGKFHTSIRWNFGNSEIIKALFHWNYWLMYSEFLLPKMI